MHTVVQDSATPAAASVPLARVAVAGATGFTGQELLRLLSRHPAVALTAAMSSGQTGASSRRPPALTRLWYGATGPLSTVKRATYGDISLPSLPDAAGAGN